MKKITAILLGAGQRGAGAYAPYALDFPEEFQVIGVAEPDEKRRKEFQQIHNIKEEYCFSSWEKLLTLGKIADAALICTQDQMHYEPTMKALEIGYHVLLEKPMSSSPAECIRMADYAKENNRILSICHVLRYTPFFSTIKRLIDSGKIGDVVSLKQDENVSYWHQAHSFVRGNWRSSKASSPMILQKSCHDMDIILWIINHKCNKISSFGSLMHFTSEHAPDGAPERCLDGCKNRDDCVYYAPNIYVNCEDTWQSRVIKKVVSVDTSIPALIEALKTGPYGRCVYHCDNDVVDHQVVNMEFEGGATASFTMCAFAYNEGRKIEVMGTKGAISAASDTNKIEVRTFLTGEKEIITLLTSHDGHGGGDSLLIKDFIEQVRTDGKYKGRTSAEVSVQSHLMAMAAEKSRVEGKIVDLEVYTQEMSSGI